MELVVHVRSAVKTQFHSEHPGTPKRQPTHCWLKMLARSVFVRTVIASAVFFSAAYDAAIPQLDSSLGKRLPSSANDFQLQRRAHVCQCGMWSCVVWMTLCIWSCPFSANFEVSAQGPPFRVSFIRVTVQSASAPETLQTVKSESSCQKLNYTPSARTEDQAPLNPAGCVGGDEPPGPSQKRSAQRLPGESAESHPKSKPEVRSSGCVQRPGSS